MKAVISLGNPLKSDDNIANIIIDKLDLKNVKKIKAQMNPENFLKEIKECKKIVFIDAIEFGGRIGDVKVFNLEDVKDVPLTTHTISICLIREMIPNSEIKIIGIQPKKVEFGTKLSKELEREIDRIVEKIKNIINSL
jgi:hydrogenase maturation protease